MTPELILGAIVLAPVAALILLRANAALVFLSLCAGSVLSTYAAQDVTALVQMFSAHAPGAVTASENVKLVLLILPAALTTILMIKTVKKKSLIFNALPAVGVGFLAALLVVPLLPIGVRFNITGSSFWEQGQQIQGYVIGLTASVSLLTIWMQRPKHGGHHEEKHGKH